MLDFRGKNLISRLAHFALSDPDKTALITSESAWTYAALWQAVQVQSRVLTEMYSVKPGDRVALLAWNTPFWVIHYFALLSLNAVVIPLNTRLSFEEWESILQDAAAVGLLLDPDFLEQDAPAHWHRSSDFWVYAQALEIPTNLVKLTQAKHNKVEHYALGESAKLAVLIYTSGTTGKPKGVMLSHQNIAADAHANCQVIEATARDVFITVSPLFHVFGQTNVLLSAFGVGGTVVLVKKFSPKAVLEAIETHKVTFLAAVPTMYQMMMAALQELQKRGRRFKLNSLRVCHSGAAPMPVAVLEQVEKVFGAPVQEGYGLSEASSIVCSNPLHGPRKPGTVGLALPGVTLGILDECGQMLPPRTMGEIAVRGPIVMMGYWQRPEETAHAVRQGWLHTKDMGMMDEDGYVRILDREDDLINRGGSKIYPREVEEVLYLDASVQSCAVIGVASELYHQEVKAFVVLTPEVAGSFETSTVIENLKKHCQLHLADYKVPRFWAFIQEIPKGATGKILRRQLRQLVENQEEQ
ncbi:MAG: AMP-binding protein [Cyanobacteria bacterium]|nr:AMP-binding protein [Cyanobacteriota bacterium]